MPVPPEVKRQMDAEIETALKVKFLDIAEELIGLTNLQPRLLAPLGIEHIGNLTSDQMMPLFYALERACWMRRQIEDSEQGDGFLQAFAWILLGTSNDHEAIVRRVVRAIEEQSRIVSLESS